MRLVGILGMCGLGTLLPAVLFAAQGTERWCGGEWRPVVGTWAVEGEHFVQGDDRLHGAWTLWQGGGRGPLRHGERASPRRAP